MQVASLLNKRVTFVGVQTQKIMVTGPDSRYGSPESLGIYLVGLKSSICFVYMFIKGAPGNSVRIDCEMTSSVRHINLPRMRTVLVSVSFPISRVLLSMLLYTLVALVKISNC